MTFVNLQPLHYEGEICFACSLSRDKGGRLVLKGKNRKFLGCSRYPDCKNTVSSRLIGKKDNRPDRRKKNYPLGMMGGTRIIK